MTNPNRSCLYKYKTVPDKFDVRASYLSPFSKPGHDGRASEAEPGGLWGSGGRHQVQQVRQQEEVCGGCNDDDGDIIGDDGECIFNDNADVDDKEEDYSFGGEAGDITKMNMLLMMLETMRKMMLMTMEPMKMRMLMTMEPMKKRMLMTMETMRKRIVMTPNSGGSGS